jgi:hypothetical protein
MLLRGASPEEVDATRTEDHLGTDAVVEFNATAEVLLSEFRMTGALTRRVHHPIGERTGRELLGMRVIDVTVHTWDLSRSVDADATLDPTLVQCTLLEVTGRHGLVP